MVTVIEVDEVVARSVLVSADCEVVVEERELVVDMVSVEVLLVWDHVLVVED